MQKPLIVFYSLDGFTKHIAKIIAHKTDGELLELHPQKAISRGFMKYVRGGRQVMMKETPELKPYHIDLKNHDIIYIGTPVWAWTYTPAVKSFLKNIEIKNKKVVLFCTYDGMAGKTLENLETDLPGNTIISKKGFHRKFLEKNEKKLEEEINKLLEHLK